MSWTPDFRDTGTRKGDGGMLTMALRLSKENLVHKLRDNTGVFAYITENSVLCAKGYIYGNVVSCHIRALISAYNHKLPLRMYIDSTGTFYDFDAQTIYNNHKRNKKGSATMANFNIKYGTKKEQKKREWCIHFTHKICERCKEK